MVPLSFFSFFNFVGFPGVSEGEKKSSDIIRPLHEVGFLMERDLHGTGEIHGKDRGEIRGKNCAEIRG